MSPEDIAHYADMVRRQRESGALPAAANEPRIVTPQEALHWIDSVSNAESPKGLIRAMHTVATEPDRTRAAVVKALRVLVDYQDDAWIVAGERADAIENGAPFDA